MSDTLEQAAEARYKKLTETPVPKLVVSLAIPTIISMMVTGLYNAADTYFVGKISTQATAAVGLVFSIMAIIQALGFFCGHGSGNFLSRKLGEENYKEANEMAATGFTLALILGIAFAVIGNLNIETLSHWIGATPTTLKDTEDYMSIILLGAPIMCGQFVINNQLRFQGSAIYAMIGLMCGAVVNVALDPILIFGFDLGVRGAAIATVSGQLMSFCVLFVGSRKGANIRLAIRNIRLTPYYLIQIVNGGAPSLLRQGLAAVSTLLLNHIAKNFGGDATIAGMSVTTRVIMLVFSALIGFGQGYQPLCSFNYGAEKKERVREGYFFCVKWGSIVMTIATVLLLIFSPEIIRWFRNDDAVVAVGSVALRFQAITLPINAVLVMSNMMLQSIGKGVKASISASAKNGIFFIPLVLILPQFFGLLGLEMTQMWADVCAVALSIPFAWSELRKMKAEKP